MIRTLLSIAVVGALAFSAEAGTLVTNIDDVSYWVGSGENRAVMIIDWQDNKNAPGETAGEALAWGYRWPVGETRTGQQMLEAIALADPRLFLQLDHFGGAPAVFGLAYDLDGDGGTFTFDTVNEQGSASDSDDHFAEGWEVNGFWWYKIGRSASAQRPGWKDSTSGFATRALTNNSWDAWVFSTDPDNFVVPDPSVALAVVPEPSTAALFACGGLLAVRRRPRR